MGETNRTHVAIGVAALFLGTLVYFVDRPPNLIFVPSDISLFHHTPKVFGVIGHSLPTFAHVFAFSLLLGTVLGDTKKTRIIVCLGWFTVDSLFELGQHPQVSELLLNLIPQWCEKIPLLYKTDSYFLYGTFDPLDMLSIALGALAAYAVFHLTYLHRKSHEYKK